MRQLGLGRGHFLRDLVWLAALVAGTGLVPDTAGAQPDSPQQAPDPSPPVGRFPAPPNLPAEPEAPRRAEPDAPDSNPDTDAPPSAEPDAPDSNPDTDTPPPAAPDAPGTSPDTNAPTSDSPSTASDDSDDSDAAKESSPPSPGSMGGAPDPGAIAPQSPETEGTGWEPAHDEDPANDPLAQPSARPLSHELLAAWKGDFERAKQLLRQGQFTEAGALLEIVAARAPSAAEAATARELAALCYYWSSRGIHFGEPESATPAVTPTGPRRRSTGEIASLYVNAVVYGLGTGAWLGVLSEPDSAGGFFLPTLAVTGAAIGVVAVVDRDMGLRYGVPQSISSGMYVGFSQGLLWSLAYNAQAPYADEWSPATVASMMWGGATVGAISGGVIGQKAGTTPGRAAWVGSTALWGGVLGGLTVGGSVPDDARTDERALLGAALFSTGGTVAGVLSAGSVSPSLARVRFLDLGGLVGGLLGLGVYATATDDTLETHGTLWAMNLGAASGLLVSWALTSGMEPDRGDHQHESSAADGPLESLLRARPAVLPATAGAQLGLVGSW